MEKIKKLMKYGDVQTCKLVHEDVATILITDFKANAMRSFDFIKECTECFPDHPVLETCIIDDAFAMVVLVKNKS